MMTLLLLSVALLILTSLLCPFLRKVKSAGAWGASIACLVGLVPALACLVNGRTESFHLPWSVPGGSFYVTLDPLSAFFLVPLFLLSLLSAIYGNGYLAHSHGGKEGRTTWPFYNMLVASMVMVVIARNGVLFLVAWEMMSLSSFFLVTFEDDKESVRAAGLTYLIAAHLGTACLIPMFLLLAGNNGPLDFDAMDGALLTSGTASAVFLLAFAGFGTKAGFMPFHVWLPEAHPAAPTHVSALMSGVMITTGIYGLVRVLTFLPEPLLWWGILLTTIGIISGILGVLFALAQHDLKRLLAYSTVENVGIIGIGLGMGLIGLSLHIPVLATLGFAGALLHVLNHALFKGLLFLGAGAVLQAAGSVAPDRLGGLLKRMPVTGLCFLVGAAAICGLPPLNGFVSEFLIFFASFQAVLMPGAAGIPALAAVAALAVIGCLAAACFAKAFGIVFLGEPRHTAADAAREAAPAMTVPQAILAGLCVAIGLAPLFVLPLLAGPVSALPGLDAAAVAGAFALPVSVLTRLSVAAAVLIGFALLLLALRSRRLSAHAPAQSVTWDCGYARPKPRMQYTASSFVQPLTAFFAPLLGTHTHTQAPRSLFPRFASFESSTPDAVSGKFYAPLFRAMTRGFSHIRWFQHGRIQLYILYITVTLIVLLLWKTG
ncbi:MAG: proton-conducting transporter membrane subunit [Fibrobacterota bacterium]